MKKNNFAVFTITRNESFFLQVWCDYYARNFGEENLYILDNSTNDNSIENVLKRWPKLNIKSVPSKEAMLYGWTTEVVKSFQQSALKANKVVLFSDTDEFLIPSQKFANLKEYCDLFLLSNNEYVRAKGYGVIQQIDNEPIFNNGFLLENRNTMYRTNKYDKTLISKKPLHWAKGIHTIYDENGKKLNNDPIDEDLLQHSSQERCQIFSLAYEL